jgi:ribosome biogenesis GTPase
VGDIVELENENDQESTMINDIHPRRNYIVRTSPHNKNQHHIIAANINQTLLFATLKDPKTSLGFIDRFLVTAEAYHIPAIIVFNKIDLLNEMQYDELLQIKNMYEQIGYTILLISVEKKIGLDDMKALLENKTTLISGHSGVGKSTFINHIFPEHHLKTQEVSDWSGKGMHTTTFAEMFDLPFGGQLIDTPGIRELGLVDIQQQELSHFFPEMKALIQDCQFNNCIHLNEPHCAIKKAVMDTPSKITEHRYMSYLNILDSIEKKSF